VFSKAEVASGNSQSLQRNMEKKDRYHSSIRDMREKGL
jgi:hypothetical protein